MMFEESTGQKVGITIYTNWRSLLEVAFHGEDANLGLYDCIETHHFTE